MKPGQQVVFASYYDYDYDYTAYPKMYLTRGTVEKTEPAVFRPDEIIVFFVCGAHRYKYLVFYCMDIK